mgnify:CR=1 FL=1
MGGKDVLKFGMHCVDELKEAIKLNNEATIENGTNGTQ